MERRSKRQIDTKNPRNAPPGKTRPQTIALTRRPVIKKTGPRDENTPRFPSSPSCQRLISQAFPRPCHTHFPMVRDATAPCIKDPPPRRKYAPISLITFRQRLIFQAFPRPSIFIFQWYTTGFRQPGFCVTRDCSQIYPPVAAFYRVWCLRSCSLRCGLRRVG